MFVCLLLLAATDRPVEPGAAIKASRSAHVLMLSQVFLNGQGPFRMLIDTGATSSRVRPSVAGRLNLRPDYELILETVSGSRVAPATVLREVRVGAVVDRGVEAIIGDVRLFEADGSLGQSWLARHDYLLDYRHRQVVLDRKPREGGIQTPMCLVEGRPLVVAEVDGRRSELFLDSGTPILILFERADRTHTIELITANGPAVGQFGSARVALGGLSRRHMKAVRMDSGWTGPGLMPLNRFSAVHISNSGGFVVLFE